MRGEWLNRSWHHRFTDDHPILQTLAQALLTAVLVAAVLKLVGLK